MTDSFYRAREEFGTRLRRLREHSGLNGKQLAAALSWPHSKVSKIELGRQRPTPDDVCAWLAATGRTDAVEGLLVDPATCGSRRHRGPGSSAAGAALHGISSDVDSGVRVRLRRQQVLYEPGKSLRFLLTEAAIRYRRARPPHCAPSSTDCWRCPGWTPSS